MNNFSIVFSFVNIYSLFNLTNYYIAYIMKPIIHLKSRNISLVIKTLPIPEILHWGAKIATLDADLLLATARPIAQARLDVDMPITLCPELGRGYFNALGIEGQRSGLDWSPVFEVQAVTCDENSAIFELVDNIAGVQLAISLTLDATTDVLQKQITITNIKAGDYTLNKLALTLPVPRSMTELMTFHGRWCHEFHTQRIPFKHGGFIQENRRGRTSHENFPGIFAGVQNFSEQTGEVYGFHLGWSGNHLLRADVKSDGRRFVQAGELLLSGEIILKEGESYTTPTFYATYSQAGLNQVSVNFQQFVRHNILKFPENKPRPVHLNTWEGIYFEHNPEYIMQMATESAKMGVERFIIDDGWFKGRNGERAALGDWYVDARKYPNGLAPVVQHVLDLGMEFGIWFEPEMVSPDSDLYRTHPDWVLGIKGYDQPTGRYQYILDLQNENCFNYLFERLDSILSEFEIAYVKWDMNREMIQPAHEGRPAVHNQTKTLYRLFEQLEQAHPTVEFESCSSGGGRIDYEMLKKTHRFWASDCNDALERQAIQKGMSYFFPPEVVGAHIGAKESHSTRRMHHINMRGVTALSGHMGVELDPVSVSQEERDEFAKYIKLHKQFRGLLHSGENFRLDCNDNRQNIYGVKDENTMLIVVCQLSMPEYSLPAPLRIDYLDGNATYAVKMIEIPEASFQLMKQKPAWLDSELTLSGDYLKAIGLSLPILDPESALVLSIIKQYD